MRKGMVSSLEVVRHIEYLRRMGVPISGIADAAGVQRKTVTRLAAGRDRIQEDTYYKIMSVSLQQATQRSAPKGFVPAAGARRRIRALQLNGWDLLELERQLGFHIAKFVNGGDRRNAAWMHARHRKAVDELYERLWNVRGPGRKEGITYAKRSGYVPDMAWDEDEIDDPRAKPGR